MSERNDIKVAIIGAGNVAHHLAPALDNAELQVVEVYSRNIKHAETLAKNLYNAEVKPHLDFSESKANIFILTVSDMAIAEVAKEIVLPEHALLVHTSGSISIDTLNFAAPGQMGVLYPVQTFTKGKTVDFEHIPLCIEGSDAAAEAVLQFMASSISSKVYLLNSENRKKLHISAVFACNFTNHLLRLSKEILSDEGIDFQILEPLIVETINKSLMLGPENSQTGPAVRGDVKILSEHMNQLIYNEDYINIYKVMSNSILAYSLNKNDSQKE